MNLKKKNKNNYLHGKPDSTSQKALKFSSSRSSGTSKANVRSASVVTVILMVKFKNLKKTTNKLFNQNDFQKFKPRNFDKRGISNAHWRKHFMFV
jgi:hypothetical protein